MFNESVDQNAIIPISAGGNSNQNLLPQPTVPGWLTIGPKPPALVTIQTSRPSATTRTKGAAQFSNRRTASMPRMMMKMLIAQKMAKLSQRVQGCPPNAAELVQELPNDLSIPLRAAPVNVYRAPPPIQVWMPNQPQATPARSRAATVAPKTPHDARA